MCRIGVFQNVGDKILTAWAMAELEISMGGHGNGLYMKESDKLIKGRDASITNLAEMTEREEGMHLFHTRLASVGDICDELCHPFEAGDWILCHNGSWMDWDLYADDPDDRDSQSDSMVVAGLVEKYGIGILASHALDYSGVWVFMSRNPKSRGAWVIRRGGEFVLQPFTGTDGSPGFFHASESLVSIDSFCTLDYTERLDRDRLYYLKEDGSAEPWDLEAVNPPKQRSWAGSKWWKQNMSYGYGTAAYAAMWESDPWDDDDAVVHRGKPIVTAAPNECYYCEKPLKVGERGVFCSVSCRTLAYERLEDDEVTVAEWYNKRRENEERKNEEILEALRASNQAALPDPAERRLLEMSDAEWHDYEERMAQGG